jgi:uncharacterized protein (TIGR03083 family)
MRIAEHIDALGREGARFITAVDAADKDAMVPSCPEWTVRELAHHMGRVQRWAATYVRDARPERMTDDERERAWGAMPADADLTGWLRAGLANIVEALEKAPDDLECFTFLAAPSARAFWARRQAHEIAIHRADAQGVTGDVDDYPADFAVDGVDELLLAFYARRNRVASDEQRALGIRATDAGASWMVHFSTEGARGERGIEGGTADCVLSGPASAVYLYLWNRTGRQALDVKGDAAVLDLWSDKATIRWS